MNEQKQQYDTPNDELKGSESDSDFESIDADTSESIDTSDSFDTSESFDCSTNESDDEYLDQKIIHKKRERENEFFKNRCYKKRKIEKSINSDKDSSSEEYSDDLNKKKIIENMVLDILGVNEPIENTWINGLSSEEINKYEPIFELICEEIYDREIKVVDIIKSDMSLHEKVLAVEEFKVMNSTKIDTELWLELKRMLYRKVKKMCPITDNDREIICKLEKMSHVDISIQQKIVRSNHSEKIKSIMYDKYRNIKSVDEDNWEYNKTIEWINRGLKIPTEVIELKSLYNTPLLMIQHIYANIDNSMYGQQRAKEQILEYMSTMWANQKNNKNNKNYPVTFIGSPGVGKTAFARLLANGLQLPFYQISLGGIRDSSHLEGHSATYVSSKPGEIYNAISSMGIKNGILFLDELDKVQNSEVIASLIHILDPTQNYEFKDNYMPEIPIDLSKLFIIISVNDEKVIDSVLKDRLYFINFSRYGIEEKVNIGLKYIVPRKLNDLDISHNDILVTARKKY
jgi:ATP-dependent Lon protease